MKTEAIEASGCATKMARLRAFFHWSAAAALAVMPALVLWHLDVPLPAIAVSGFASVGWLGVIWLLRRDEPMARQIEVSAASIGIKLESGADLERQLENFTEQTLRYHRAAFSGQLGESTSPQNINENLERILQLAHEELKATSVELSLFDEDSGTWTQAMLVGEPHSRDTQSMLLGEVDRCAAEVLDMTIPTSPQVCARPVAFAGSLFGALRVEIPEGREFSSSDKQVVQLLATQGALMMIDAEFTDELLRMRRLSEESTKAKTGFLANLSHEIRGPLGIILNGAELALEGLCGEFSESMRDSLRMIKGSGEHLLDLVNDVLDYAKVEAGKIKPNPAALPVKALLDDMVTVVRSQAVAKKHKLTLRPIDPKFGIVCDKRHIRQMLINFLTNAIKYTPDGGEIEVWAEKLPYDRIKISIKDSGIGIPESESHKVFGAFERVDDKYALTQMGTGLGMPLTKSLAEVNRGSVGFESVHCEGSTFWLNLPFAEIDGQDLLADSGQFKGAVVGQGQGELVLVVDHDVPTRTMICRYLDQQGFRTVTVGSAAEMLKVLRQQPVELAIVENDFPGLPGEEIVSTMRATPNAATTPIILLSARAFVFDIERFLKLGVDRCLSKPVSLAELAVTTRRLIDQNRSLERPLAH